MLVLMQGPERPDHVTFDADGIAYARQLRRVDEVLPDRFRGPARPEAASGPPWAALVFGLETGAFDMRARFLAALRDDAAAGRPLVRYGDALEAAFRRSYGGRGGTSDTPGFLEFVQAARAGAASEAEREQLARGLRDIEATVIDGRIAQAGAHAISFGLETGHWPADHPEVLYWLSALVPGLRDAHFAQVVDANGDEGDEESASFELVAWCVGLEITTPALNLGDFVDAWSCVGLINVLLRDVVGCDARVFLRCEDEGALAVCGSIDGIRQLQATGVLGSDEDDDDEDE